jgi:hypothetical protein
MARKMKKFSAGGAQGRYDRRMADIDKDFAKDSKGKSGKALEILEAKRAQRTADAKDDLAKRTGADRTATRAAERAAESNLTKTRKYGAPKAVTAEAPTSKVMDTLGPMTLPKSGISSASAKPVQKSVQKPVRKPVQQPAPTPEKKATPEKIIAPSRFDSKAFADLKAKAGAGKTPPATGGTLLRGKPGGTPLFRVVKADDPARVAKLAGLKRAAEAPGASQFAKDRYKDAVSSGMYAKGGAVKEKDKVMMNKKSTPPQPTPADRARSKKQLDSLKKAKTTPAEGKVVGSANRSEGPGYKKGGKMATKFGAAMKKKSADTKGRAMMKFAKGGSIDGCAVKGKTKTSMIKMKNGGSC